MPERLIDGLGLFEGAHTGGTAAATGTGHTTGATGAWYPTIPTRARGAGVAARRETGEQDRTRIDGKPEPVLRMVTSDV